MARKVLDLPFDGTTNRFIVYYVETQDLRQSAKSCGITEQRGKLIYRKPDVRAEINRRLELYFQEAAYLRAQANHLDESLLDATLVELIENDDTPASVKAQLVATGYKKMGFMKDKVEHTGEGGGAMVFTLNHIVPKKSA